MRCSSPQTGACLWSSRWCSSRSSTPSCTCRHELTSTQPTKPNTRAPFKSFHFGFVILREGCERLARVCLVRMRVEEVVKFPGLPPRRQLTYQAKQTVSREMEQEKMRRAEQLLQRRNTATVVGEKEKKAEAPRTTKNHQQRLENIVKQTTVEVRPEMDFFGRVVAPKLEKKKSSSEPGEKSVVEAMGVAVGNSDVWFRFNEGMSNAVRRNVYIRELL